MISIVIPTYNSSRFMPALMDSVFKQVSDDMEVIIVDDCSTDDTIEIAKKYPTRIIQMEQNGGPAKSRNRAVDEAKGDIIFFLDSDVEVLDGTVQEVKEYFEKNPRARCVIGICSIEPLNKGFVPTYMAMFEYIHLIDQEYKKVSVFAPRCGAIKKELFKSAGGYDENYKGADVEDFELARRINKTDDIILNPKMIVKHQFADFKQVIKNYFKRTAMWVKLFIKEKKLDNAGPTAPSNGIAAICAFLSFLILLAIPVAGFAKLLFWTLIAIYLVSNFKWWNFMLREAGFGFAVRALPLNYFLGIEIIASALYALISYSFSKDDSLGGL